MLWKLLRERVSTRPARRSPVSSSFVCAVEPLESRQLLSASLTVDNLDILPGAERMIFNRIGSPNKTIPNYVKDRGTIRLTNTGDATLRILSSKVNGPFKVLGILPKSIPAGKSVTVTVQFTATSVPKLTHNETSGTTATNRGGAWIGSLVLNTNASNAATYTEELAGWYQVDSEKNEEPNLQTLVNLIANYKTTIAPANTVLLTEPTNSAKYYGEETVSAYWKVANSAKPVGVRQLATWHTQGNDVTTNWYSKTNSATHNLFITDGVAGQSFLPYKKGQKGVAAFSSFSPGTALFGFKVDQEWSDDKKNTAHPAGGGHHMRFYPLRDHNGNILANTYLMTMDYSIVTTGTAQNFDFQDNVYIITNVQPAGN